MSVTNHTNDSTSKINTDTAIRVQALQEPMSSIKHKFLFISTQGGVGKTNAMINIAMSLSKSKMTVGLMDINYNSPDVHRMLGLEPAVASDSDNRFIPMAYLDALKVASIESVMKERDEETGVWGKPLKISDILRFISSIYWGDLDYLFVDTPAGPGEKLLSVIQSIPDAKIIIVTAPDMIRQDIAKKMINFFKKEDISIFGWIENMQGFLCQNCGQHQELISTGPVNRAVFLNEIPFLGRIPIDVHLRESTNTWEAFYEKHPSSQAMEPYDLIAQKIMGTKIKFNVLEL